MSTTHPTSPIHSRPVGPSRGPATAPSIDPFRVLRKHMTTIIAAAVAGVIFGVALFAVLFITMPRYTGVDMYEIMAPINDPNQVIGTDIQRQEVVVRLARTEMAYILSREVLSRAMAVQDVERTEWAAAFKDRNGVFLREDAVDELIDELVLRQPPETQLFEVRFSAANPADVPVILKAIREQYLKYRKEIDQGQFGSDIAVFATQEGEINSTLATLNTNIRNFVRDHNILTLNDIRNHPLSAEVQALNQTLGEQRAMLNVLASQREQYRAKMAGQMEFTEEDRLRAEADPNVSRLVGRVDDLKIERARRVEAYGPDHSSVRDIEMLVRVAEEQLEIKIQEVMRRNLTGGLKAIANQIESVTNLIADVQERLAEKDADLQRLAGEVSEYESLLRRRDDLHLQLRDTQSLITEAHRVRLRTASDRVRLASAAQTPRERSFPAPEIIIPLGFLLVVGATIGIIFLRELTDKRVKTVSDLAVVPGARVLGMIPDLADDPTRISQPELAVLKEPRSVIAESYRQACAPILKSMERQGHQTLVVIGGLPGAGTTTAVTNLAAFLAAGGRSVLAIDANFRRPRLASALGCDAADSARGLGDVLAGACSVADAIQPAAGGGIRVIPAGSPANRTFERLNDGRFDAILAEVRSQYDYILIDSPPAVVAGDAMVIANRTDASLLVVRANQEQRGLVAKLINSFNDAQSDLLGVILNRPRWTAGGYFRKNFATMAEYAAKG